MYIYYCIVWRATSGRRTPGGRRTGGHPGGTADRGGALYCGWAYMLTLWGKGGCGGSPNVEAGKGASTELSMRHSPRESQRNAVAAPCALARAYHVLFVLRNMRLSHPYFISYFTFYETRIRLSVPGFLVFVHASAFLLFLCLAREGL